MHKSPVTESGCGYASVASIGIVNRSMTSDDTRNRITKRNRNRLTQPKFYEVPNIDTYI